MLESMQKIYIWIFTIQNLHAVKDRTLATLEQAPSFGLVVAPRTSLVSLPSKVTALPCASEDRSERLNSYPIIIILYYEFLNFNHYIKY